MVIRRTLFIASFLAMGAAGCLTGVSQTNPGDPSDDAGNSMPDGGNLDATAIDDTSRVDDTSTSPDMSGAADSATPGDMTTVSDARNDPDMMTMLPPGVCGNNIVEAGETCDDCTDLDCDDQNSCTIDELAGDPANCLGYCRNQPFFECTDGDGCCPSGCTSETDDDCSTTCGDGVIDALETCDTDCPTDCDDDDPATRDILTGSAETCNVTCSNVPITVCDHGDGYCPAGCTWATDRDCDAECGNGLIEDDETCDPPGSCSDCDDQNPCTEDTMSGDPATCDVTCSHAEITACINGDGCCGLNCTSANDDDCSPTCGDRNLDPGETCDGPPECNQITCGNAGACQSATLLTGRHQNCAVQCGYEDVTACIDNDGCCPLGCTADTDNDCNASCGNSVVEPGEYCDPPELCETACLDDGDVCTTTEYMGDPSTCDGRCEYPPVTACGPAEGCCPPGCNANNDPDCDPVCGNGVTEGNEICDGDCPSCDDADACTFDVTQGDPSTCDVICQHTDITTCGPTEGCCPSSPTQCNATNDADCAPVCGNDILESPETCDGDCPTACDDGNACTTDTLTGSAADCTASCEYSVITTCIDGDGCCPAICDTTTDTDC